MHSSCISFFRKPRRFQQSLVSCYLLWLCFSLQNAEPALKCSSIQCSPAFGEFKAVKTSINWKLQNPGQKRMEKNKFCLPIAYSQLFRQFLPPDFFFIISEEKHIKPSTESKEKTTENIRQSSLNAWPDGRTR